MSLARSIFGAITHPRIAPAVGGVVIVGAIWWGLAAGRLARRIDRGEPEVMRFEEAVAASKNSEIYVRFSDARLDCDKRIDGDFGSAFALLNGAGHIAAVARQQGCDPRDTQAIEGVFRDPPYLLYGEAMSRGWDVTPGHLAFIDRAANSSETWKRVGVAAAVGVFTLASVASTLARRRVKGAAERGYRIRAMGFALLAMAAGLAQVGRDYAILGAIPVRFVAIAAALIALGMIVFPRHPFIEKVTARLVD